MYVTALGTQGTHTHAPIHIHTLEGNTYILRRHAQSHTYRHTQSHGHTHTHRLGNGQKNAWMDRIIWPYRVLSLPMGGAQLKPGR